jgi:hypothetical protein
MLPLLLLVFATWAGWDFFCVRKSKAFFSGYSRVVLDGWRRASSPNLLKPKAKTSKTAEREK